MKKLKLLLSCCVALFSFALFSADAEARRLGGGKSTGMQRQITPQKQMQQAPAQQAPNAAGPARAQQPAGAAQAAGKRSWLGPIAGLAAGIGLAALLSHFGLGEEMAGFIMLLLLIGAAFLLFRFLFRRTAAQSQNHPDLQQVGVGGPGFTSMPNSRDTNFRDASFRDNAAQRDSDPGNPEHAAQPQPTQPQPVSQPVSQPIARRIPDDFDSEGFLRTAKLNFVRLQAANDTCNIDDLREFLEPELFAEVRLQIEERKAHNVAKQRTDIVTLEAELLELVSEQGRYVASIHFHGMIREDEGGHDQTDVSAVSFDEVWHLVKPESGEKGWTVAGIQQLS